MTAGLASRHERFVALDAIRGIASLCVVVWHCYNALTNDMRAQLGWFTTTPLRLFLNGDAAVIVFFVLSGYVLSLPYLSGQPPRYWHYCVRRFCRIYLPFAATILAAALIFCATERNPIPGEAIWPNALWLPGSLDLDVVVRHLLMVGTVDATMLDGPTWTLAHELRISLIFPLLVKLCRDTKLGIISGVAIFFVSQAFVAATGSIEGMPSGMVHPWQTWLVTADFIPCFIVGILLAKHRQELREKCARLYDWQAAGLWVLIVIAFTIFPDYFLKQIIVTGGAALLIVKVMSSATARAFLHTSWLQWLGRISYSLYLINAPILFGTLFAFHHYASLPLLLPFSIAVSLGVATLMHRWIELPAIALGKRLTQRS